MSPRVLGVIAALVLAACSTEPECELGYYDVCGMKGLTCDLATQRCVERPPCTWGPRDAACADEDVCYSQPTNFEGQVSRDPNGCLKSCMVPKHLDWMRPESFCNTGYVCDEQTYRCVLPEACRPGSLDCAGANCTPEGRCEKPVRCDERTTCPGGFACDVASGTCYRSCASFLHCAEGLSCDLSTHLCR